MELVSKALSLEVLRSLKDIPRGWGEVGWADSIGRFVSHGEGRKKD